MNFTKDDLEDILYSLEGYIQGNDDEELVEKLEDICYRIERKLKDEDIIDSQELEGDISTVKDSDYDPVIINLPEGTNLTRVIRSDDDYAECVDTLVDKMRTNV